MDNTQVMEKPDNIPVVYSIPQLAAVSGLPLHAIRRWIKEGKFPVVRSGRKIFINLDVFNNFLTSGCMFEPVSGGIRQVK